MPEPTKIACLGKEFNSEEERREYFRNELRAKLPELKKIEGFPIGEDEDIINLSDPPYYTACPNPWLNDFIEEWEKEKEHIPGRKKDFHVDEPYASDVSEGKGSPIYNAHNYHTKVPFQAIMRYLLHFTQPGDIVFDGFSGTGMTGVSSIYCKKPDPQTKYLIEKEWRTMFNGQPDWGIRHTIVSDISPIASFISSNYNTFTDQCSYIDELTSIYKDVKEECKWLYLTQHTDGKLGLIDYTLWSDIYLCSNCSKEIVFWEVAIDREKGEVMDEFNCNHCNSHLTKRALTRSWKTIYDLEKQRTYQINKTKPVLIKYTYNGKRYLKEPDKYDIELIEKIEVEAIPFWFPTDDIIKGDKTVESLRLGLESSHLMFTKRNLRILSCLYSKLHSNKLKFAFTGLLTRSSKQARFLAKNFFHGGGGWVGTNLSGTLFIPSLSMEVIPIFTFENRIRAVKALSFNDNNLTSTQSASDIRNIADNCIDYIFTDPPFGSNIMYSELNSIHEHWLKVKTNIKEEAIENKTQQKTTLEYQVLMTKCFEEFYRILKNGKWMTVEFSNTSAAVWNGIQTSLQKAGFIVANVAALDKKQGSFNAVTNPTSVKQDLVISCYKPSKEFENQFSFKQGDIALWDFVLEHLSHLPTHLKRGNSTTAIIERSPKILYDRLISFFLMRGLPIPIDAKDFLGGLRQKFVERDGMYFTAEQAAEYDEKKAKSPQLLQYSLIVTNESDAIEWLKDRLRKQPQKYQDIMPDFRIATQSLRKGDVLPELQDILIQSFIQESDGRWRTPDPNEAKDREALRAKVLLKEFNGYITSINQPKAKKLKLVRVEALRAGFKNCWEQKDFKTIVNLGDMIPQNILLEDEQLLMYYDIAKDRV
jgi:DNA modification methylase/DNA-directed RNA polymerase subunit RPC12/RpoP